MRDPPDQALLVGTHPRARVISALLVPALAGFVLLFGTHLFRYWLNRQGGYKLLFATALAGAILLALARALVVIAGKEHVPEWWYAYASFQMSETVGLSVLLALVCAFLINLGFSRTRAAKLVSRNGGDLIECLLEDCLVRNAPVELTMSSGKAYIGFPRESGLTVSGESDIAIVPLASGYRDNEKKTLVVTTDYSETVYELVFENGTLSYDDFQVILPLNEVASARYFDRDAYNHLNRSGQVSVNGT